MGHWRLLPFAPKLKCYQAMSASGRTATGAGRNRVAALIRCKGELAEIDALEAHSEHHLVKAMTGAHWIGLAAGSNKVEAKERAICEAIERCATDLWWQGRFQACDMVAKGACGTGLTTAIEHLGRNVNGARAVRLYTLPPIGGTQVVIAISREAQGGNPILGYGAHHKLIDALEHALVEMAVMELNLSDTSPQNTMRLARLADGLQQSSNRLFLAHEVPVRPSHTTMQFETSDLTCSLGSCVTVARLVPHPAVGTPTPLKDRALI